MRVVYLIDGLGPGGAERSLAEIGPHLVRAGVDLHVAVLHERHQFTGLLAEGGVEVHRLAGSYGRAGWTWRFAGLVGRLQPDLVHTTLFDSDLVGRAVAGLRRTPAVSSWVNVQYGKEHLEESAAPAWKTRLVKLTDAATARLVRRFHAVSTPVATAMTRALRVDARRVEVIPRGRDRALLGEPAPARRAAVRSRLGIGSELVILNVARHDHAKGLDVLLRAWSEIAPSYPGAILLQAGREGTRSHQLRALVDDVGLGDRIRFLGVRDDVPDLLSAADLFVLPSRREGLPGALLEAMAMSVPIVATEIAATRDAVPDEEHALLVPVDDVAGLARAIDAALSDPASAVRRAATARARFDQTFTIERVARRMVGFYETALR